MKKKIVLVLSLMMILSTIVAQFAKAEHVQVKNKIGHLATTGEHNRQPNKTQRPQIDPTKIQAAKESCLQESKMTMPKKGEKLDQEKMNKFRNCMHEKLAPEINKMRQQQKK